ncbi:MAG: DUF6591 domain-containing protein [Bacteroidia bacterium]
MKKTFLTIAMAAFFSFGMISCGGGSEEATSDETTTEKTTDEGTSDEASSDESTSGTDCNKWLDDYEAYMDDYVALAKKYQANPTDMTIMQEYTSMSQKAQSMASSTPEDCAGDAAFAARLEKISAAAAGL